MHSRSLWFLSGVCAVVLSASLPAGAVAATYNVVTGFSKKTNPGGSWSYLAGGALLSHKLALNGNKRVPCWWNAEAEPSSSVVCRNQTGAPFTNQTVVLPTDHLAVDPETVANVTVRFTAPGAGHYTIKGDFLGIDTNEASHPVEILQNGSSVFGGTISRYQQSVPFKLKLVLAAGDTVDFASVSGGFSYESTGLATKITAQ